MARKEVDRTSKFFNIDLSSNSYHQQTSIVAPTRDLQRPWHLVSRLAVAYLDMSQVIVSRTRKCSFMRGSSAGVRMGAYMCRSASYALADAAAADANAAAKWYNARQSRPVRPAAAIHAASWADAHAGECHTQTLLCPPALSSRAWNVVDVISSLSISRNGNLPVHGTSESVPAHLHGTVALSARLWTLWDTSLGKMVVSGSWLAIIHGPHHKTLHVCRWASMGSTMEVCQAKASSISRLRE